MNIPKRVLLDSTEAQQYEDQGIHYWYNEANVTEGKLLVWGPLDTLYEDMPMVYSVKFPCPGYPFEPPKVLFLTNDGYTRFHPNMYKEGKVCLSILGTWEGPRWVASQRMSSIGFTLQSLMDNNPISHEPGYADRRDPTATSYNEFIGYRCICFLIDLLNRYTINMRLPFEADYLKEFSEEFSARIPKLIERLEARLVGKEDRQWLTVPYNMTGKTDYGKLNETLSKIKDWFLKKEKLVNKS
jgi:ubiquitin-conjugating enzyme E2 Z